MKKNYFILLFLLLFSFACNDKWDDHYSSKDIEINNEAIKVVSSSAIEYISTDDELKMISELFENEGIFDMMKTKDQFFTILVYPDEVMSTVTIDDPEYFAKTCLSDLAFTPTKLTDGFSIKMWNGKYLGVSVVEKVGGKEIYIAGSKVKSIVKVNDGYIYLMESPIYAPKSLYEYLNDLGEDYSLFKELIFSYEEKVFDKNNSIPIGVDPTGNTVYDSVFVIKNVLMDRYDSGGKETWNMRSEFYSSTMLIFSNDLIENALENAYHYVRVALNREPNANDSTKFKEWIIKAAFYDRILTPADLNGTTDIYSVSGYQEGSSASTSGVQWRPTVQQVNTANPVTLSNGVAYYVEWFKIPNNVVIYRIKNRFYIWENCSEEEKQLYFNWMNIGNVDIYDNGGFGPIGPWPKIYYKCLRGYPTDEAYEQKLPVGVECTGIALNEDGTISVVMVPPGEYYLRMGFKSDKLPWRLDIYFNDQLVATRFDPNAGHFDRYGVGHPEGYIWRDWYNTDKKAENYDRDGAEVGVVLQGGTEPSPIKINMISYDLTQGTGSRNRLIIYHWCLRPTENNY